MTAIADIRAAYATTLAGVPTRDELPVLLNARGLFGCGVEIGVKEGEFSAHILRYWKGAHLISVDPWLADDADSYVDIANVPQGQHELFYQRTLERLAPFGERSSVWRMTSLEASRLIPRHSLDFVYIDARHDFDSVVQDLAAWVDKVRPGGIICGHDYIDGQFAAGVFGVRSAVDAFFAQFDVPVHATHLDQPFTTWLVEVPPPEGEELLPADPTFDPAAIVRHDRPEAPLPDRPVMVTVGFAPRGEALDIRLLLDPAHAAHRNILTELQAGTLYEPEIAFYLASVLHEGATFVDVGAHIGFFSLLAGRLVGPTGRVLAYEPTDENRARLEAHVAMNAMPHVRVSASAVAAREGRATFHINADNDGGHALWDVRRHAANERSRARPEQRTVPLTTLDAELARGGIDAVAAIKIDTEGAEFDVLRGAERTLQRCRPVVVAEVNRTGLEAMGASEETLRAYMDAQGYQAYLPLPGRAELRPLASHETLASNFVFNLVFRPREAA